MLGMQHEKANKAVRKLKRQLRAGAEMPTRAGRRTGGWHSAA